MSTETIPAMAKRLELWPLDRLKPYERNARTHSAKQIQQIQGSIREFGFTAPILVDSNDGILAGHGRLEAARALGLSEVPVVVLDHLDEKQRRAYLLADNKLAENAGWDEELLALELAQVEIDMTALGFDEEDLQRLQDGLELEAFQDVAATERAEPEHQPGLGMEQRDDDDEMADATAESGEADERHVFSVNLLWDDREVVLSAVRIAKERWSLEGTPEALVQICREWMDEQTAGTD